MPSERIELSTPGLLDQCSNHWATRAVAQNANGGANWLQYWNLCFGENGWKYLACFLFILIIW